MSFIDDDLAKQAKKNAQTSDKKKYQEALKMIKKLELEKKALLETSKVNDYAVIRASNHQASEATAFIVASDWHLEEEVKSSSISGLNKFNLDIADKRIHSFFSNSAKLIHIFNKNIKINNIVLCLLGDFISGNIHEELLENTLLRPIEAIQTAQSYILGGIYHLLSETNCKITVICSSGNHSRITAKTHISTEQGNSLESFMYHNLASLIKDKRVQFIHTDSYHQYLKVYKYNIRLHHGHAIRYAGGIGGITIPVNKAISQWDKAKKADIDIFGHFHQTQQGSKFVTNGSLIGYNAFALRIKAEFEPPQQTFFLLDKKHGRTITTPIFLE